MIKRENISSSRKGITPVIATVLLLGITVAIGLTVYTQAQGLIEDLGSDGQLQKVQATSLKLSPVFADGGQLKIRVSNTGSRAINTSKFTMYFGPPNYPNPIAYSSLPSEWKKKDGSGDPLGNNCMTGTGTVLSQGEHTSCLTGVKFPGALETVEVEARANNFDYSAAKTCSVDTSNAKSC